MSAIIVSLFVAFAALLGLPVDFQIRLAEWLRDAEVATC